MDTEAKKLENRKIRQSIAIRVLRGIGLPGQATRARGRLVESKGGAVKIITAQEIKEEKEKISGLRSMIKDIIEQ